MIGGNYLVTIIKRMLKNSSGIMLLNLPDTVKLVSLGITVKTSRFIEELRYHTAKSMRYYSVVHVSYC